MAEIAHALQPASGASGWPRLLMIMFGLAGISVLNQAYATIVQPMFGYSGMAYDADIAAALSAVVGGAVIACSALFSKQLRAAHLFAIVVMVLVYWSILTVAPHYLGLAAFWRVFPPLTLAMMIIIVASNLQFPVMPKGHPKLFRFLLRAAVVLTVAPILLTAALRGLQFPNIFEIYELRAELEHEGFAEYAIQAYITSIGPLVLAISLTQRRWFVALAFASIYIIIYGLKFTKGALFSPFLLILLWISLEYVKNPRPWHALAFYAWPLFLAFAIALFLPDSYGPSATSLVLHRSFSMPGQIFAHYVDFFSNNPHTWFSHIKGISAVIHYPYDDVLPVIISDHYPGGNQNANFLTQDAIAGGGIYAMPFVAALFGILLILINTATRGLENRVALPAVCLAAQRFSDGSLPTALLSGGVAFLVLLLWLAPREFSPATGATQPANVV